MTKVEVQTPKMKTKYLRRQISPHLSSASTITTTTIIMEELQSSMFKPKS
jgi:hypothetical protein